jgi:uncharacterized protein (DUF697 family)
MTRAAPPHGAAAPESDQAGTAAPTAPGALVPVACAVRVPGEILDAQSLDRFQAERLHAAESILRTHALLAGGAGFLPGNGIDVAAMSLAQLEQLRRLSVLYGIDFSDDLARKLVATLLNGFVPLQIAAPVADVLKMVPLLGQLAGTLSMACLGGAVSYAIGKAFVQHFESGGTFLTFDPRQVRAYFKDQYRQRLRVTRVPKPQVP